MVVTVVQNIRKIFFQGKELYYQKGEMLIRSGDIPQGVYFVKKGNVKMDAIFENGRELTINIFKSGSYFPMMWALSDINNTYNYVAINEVVLKRVPKELFLESLKKDPQLLLEFTKRLLIGLSGLITNIEYLLFGSSYNRIASAIVLMAKRFGIQKDKNGKKIIIEIPLTHQDLANLTAITRESASVVIGKLKKKHIISVRNKFIVVNDVYQLEKECEIHTQEDDKSISL
ncbi:hypothetical protein A3C23_01500 [Candidatus Roizmanbacteria bacterium RIFCSPHIGHO2_02_FULL_37_13b]|uniref:HTH crp-type domain-containing protein n=1 Tax=Candidatus Roizmanbacteria bacterium RIFCSPLOWO2_02_FULL_36_11 TaxID=1802071 RepID=A0A1F7JIH3_9BACT|nr:MAG: hypothetical protein A3C23_01500 [Candidatus Roizmanbacteria bacterium RIFCSPHIGHO2_02_FULL_37_13b]OGK55413.1 MAG: hypothetical protein A3H78_05970 [Candidatus Roizmanbacteria bacterium RIFCSPLOWO2_02_FULL_36_11]